MRRFGLLLVVVIAAACLTGCGRTVEPQPLTAEEERRFEEHLEAVEEFERSGGLGPE